jgi:hypothetical protein
MTKEELLEKAGLKHMVVAGMKYHSPLPLDLQQFYCYVKDSGHSILVLLPHSKEPYEKHIIPAPVKTVLKRGYAVKNGYVSCDIPYSHLEGLITDEDDDEFEFEKTAVSGMPIVVENEGALITSTNYWTSTYAQAGEFFFSVNAGCIRLLIPDGLSPPLGDDVLDSARYVIVTRGMFHGQDGYEVLFEDNSARPFAIHTLANQWDRLIPRSDAGRTNLLFHVYRDGHLVRKMTARFRVVSHLPYLRPWK